MSWHEPVDVFWMPPMPPSCMFCMGNYIFWFFDIQSDVYNDSDWLGATLADQWMHPGGFDCTWGSTDQQTSFASYLQLASNLLLNYRLSVHIPTSSSLWHNLACRAPATPGLPGMISTHWLRHKYLESLIINAQESRTTRGMYWFLDKQPAINRLIWTAVLC